MILGDNVVGVDEIGVQPIRPDRDALDTVSRRKLVVFQPMCGTLRALSAGSTARLAADPADPWCAPFRGRVPPSLHADADAEDRRAARSSIASSIAAIMPSIAARLRLQSAKAPVARQHHPLGAGDHVPGLAVTITVSSSPSSRDGVLERLLGRAQVAGAVVDDGDGHAGLPAPGRDRATVWPTRADGAAGGGARPSASAARGAGARRRRRLVRPVEEEAQFGLVEARAFEPTSDQPREPRRRSVQQRRSWLPSMANTKMGEREEQRRARRSAHLLVDRRQHQSRRRRSEEDDPHAAAEQPQLGDQQRRAMQKPSLTKTIVASGVGRAVAGEGGRRRVHGCRAASVLSYEPALGGGHALCLARVDGDRRLQHPRQRLEAGLGDVMVVAAVEVLDVERHAGVLRQRLEELLEQLALHLADAARG